MKHILYTLCLFAFISCTTQVVTEKNASIEFNNTMFDFKTIPYKSDAECTFEVKNPGKTLLVIHNIKTSCGCTKPKWTKKPILPGKEGSITIKYDTNHPGRFRRKITVYYNGPGSPVELYIKGAVSFPEKG
ncbi:DUF1573 domain-containing protein [Puteibacter caeruleilacunae]|nr:DUF1573 domain-containing protein [Puteibacter caeruleilacunae]